MALITKSAINYYDYLTVDMHDQRLEKYPLMSSPVPIIVIFAIYLFFVQNLGPKLMANRKPYQLKTIMAIYNVLQIFANFGLGCWGIYELLFKNKFNWSCELPNYNDDYTGRTHLLLTYLYFLLKILDFMDTIFFVLRKKFNQVTFLHVYHHCCMVIGTYLCVKYFPGGHVAFLGIINTFVHSIMYTYYFAAIIKPSIKSSIGYKKYITQIQMFQFGFLILHFLRPIISGNKCDYPKVVSFIGVIQNLFMFVLFSDFYIRAYYISKNKQQKINETKVKM